MLRRTGFSSKWIKWIEGCLRSASLSILVNGSPSTEFIPQRGLRQGDPLAPLLFNVVVEALNGLMREAVEKNLFRGFPVDSNNVGISILQFAMVLGRKSNHSLGVGSAPITKKFSHKQIIQNQLENTQNRANNLELEEQKLINITKKQEDVIIQLHIEVQSQQELIETNREQMKQNLENEVKRQIVDILEELSTSKSPTNSSSQVSNTKLF